MLPMSRRWIGDPNGKIYQGCQNCQKQLSLSFDDLRGKLDKAIQVIQRIINKRIVNAKLFMHQEISEPYSLRLSLDKSAI